MLKNTFIFFLFAFVALSCGNTASKEVKVEGHFSVLVPGSMVPVNDTALQSLLNYQDTLRNTVFFITSESKDSMLAYGLNYTLQKYFEKTSKNLMSKLQSGNMAVSYPDTINGKSAMVGNITGSVQSERLFYKLVILETKTDFYQLIWAMLDASASRYHDKIEESI